MATSKLRDGFVRPSPIILAALGSSIALWFCVNCSSSPRNSAHRNDAPWQQLFNGRDLTGWKHVGPGYMTVEADGLIHTHGGMGLLYWTGGRIGDCAIRVVFRMVHENDNSGVFIRVPLEPREPWMPVHYGYEVQIENHPERFDPPEDPRDSTGTLYSITKALAQPGRPGPQWNTMEITLRGPRTVVFVNGVKTTDYTEGDPVPERKFDYQPLRGPRPLAGYIGLQNESDQDLVLFKEIALHPPDTASPHTNSCVAPPD